ncbi:thioredoxin domain-containing protein 3 homolog isoform X2 [Diadema setosum]|uniref:thioredoxin domain-containing protein 3 homolog isoform X2 n=1 Tax=Diadema setosum TaxID=31175 RepID=UPI003B3B26A9
MPAKKEQVALQKEILNQEQWDDLLGLEGLAVIDVYQKWCGPCAATVGLFRRLRNEIGDDLLRFAVAEADSIETLEPYRGRCEPCFLMFGTGQLVNVVRGANAPALLKTVEKELKQEHKVLEEGLERQVIKDPLLAAAQAEEEQAAKDEEMERMRQEEEARIKEIKELGQDGEMSVRPVSQGTVDAMMHARQPGEISEPIPKEVTVVLIKPDAVANGNADTIIGKIEEQGFEVLTREERTLTEEEAREFYKDQAEAEHFNELVTFMSTGPSCILVLTRGDTGEGVVADVRNLIGPKDVDLAKEEAPESLRAQFGTDKTMNAMHGADSMETAARELTFLLPNFNIPIIPGTGPPPAIEKTLALIRPNALKDHKDEILQKIQEAGFEVCLQKSIQLTEEQAKEFYKEQEGTPHFEDLIREMTSGEVLALGLAKEAAIQSWRDLIGPTLVEEAKEKAPESLRAQYTIPEAQINVVHGSDSVEMAEKELQFFFPKQTTLAVIKPDAAGEHKDAILEKIKEAGFQINLQRDVELNKELASKLYLEHEGKEFYDSLIDHMSSGLSMVMVLSREDAVDGWRTLMGPTDPEKAREEAPESLRALLGKDILQNAVHGSSDIEQAKARIERIFPDVEVLGDGKVVDSITSLTKETADVKGEEGQTEEDGGQPAEGGEQQAEQPAAEGGEQQTEQTAAEGGEQQAEQQAEQAAEGGEQKAEEPAEGGEQQAEQQAEQPAEGGEQKAEEQAAEGEPAAQVEGEDAAATEGEQKAKADESQVQEEQATEGEAQEQAPAQAKEDETQEGGDGEEEKKEEPKEGEGVAEGGAEKEEGKEEEANGDGGGAQVEEEEQKADEAEDAGKEVEKEAAEQQSEEQEAATAEAPAEDAAPAAEETAPSTEEAAPEAAAEEPAAAEAEQTQEGEKTEEAAQEAEQTTDAPAAAAAAEETPAEGDGDAKPEGGGEETKAEETPPAEGGEA